MTKDEIIKAQQIKVALRNPINQILEDEFDMVIQKIAQIEEIMITQSVEEII